MRREVKSNFCPNILSLQLQISVGQKSDMSLTKLKQGIFTIFFSFSSLKLKWAVGEIRFPYHLYFLEATWILWLRATSSYLQSQQYYIFLTIIPQLHFLLTPAHEGCPNVKNTCNQILSTQVIDNKCIISNSMSLIIPATKSPICHAR